MTQNIAHYLSPMIFPLFPEEAGTVYIDYNLNHIFDVRGGGGFNGQVTVTVRQFVEGDCGVDDVWTVEVTDNRVAQPVIQRRLSGQGYGYVEIHIEADAPAFRKILAPPGYALLRTRSGSAIVLVSDQKYANPRVVDEIRETGTFCMVHTAGYVDPSTGFGNSLLLINPYEQTVVTRIHGENGRRVTERLPSRSVRQVPLDPVLTPGQWGTYMVTGNNRMITYDIRHAYGQPTAITSLDHLDVFSGMRTHREHGAVDWARSASRRFLRERGLRYS